MNNTLLRSLIVLSLLSVAMPPLSYAQTQRRGGTSGQRSSRRTAPRAATANANAAAADARRRLTEQIKLLSRFLYLYGRISGTIEATERGGGRTAESRAALVTNFRNVRAGLDDLAERFSRVPSLARYSLRVTAASDLAAQAETALSANRLDEAGKSMTAAVGSLTDVLAEMR